MKDTTDSSKTDAQLYELYLVDERLVHDPEEGNLIDTYESLDAAREARRRKYRHNDLLASSYEIRAADRGDQA